MTRTDRILLKRINNYWGLDCQYPVKKGKCSQLQRTNIAFAATWIIFALVMIVAGLLSIFPIKPTGDINRDGRVNAVDLTMMARHMEGTYDLTPAQIRTGDMNHNGRIDQQDIAALVDMLLERPAN